MGDNGETQLAIRDDPTASAQSGGGGGGAGMDVGANTGTQKLMSRFTKRWTGRVEKSDLLDLLKKTKHQRDSFLKLPFTICYFGVFCMAVLNHEHVAESSMLQRQLRGMLAGTTFEGVEYTAGHKDLGDIDTPDDWYLYMKEVVIPMFINPADTPAEERHRILRYNQIVGGLQIQQVRRRKVMCSTEYPDLGPFPRAGRTNPILADFACYPWYTESDDCYGPWNQTQRLNLPGGFCPDSKKDLETGLGLNRRLWGNNQTILQSKAFPKPYVKKAFNRHEFDGERHWVNSSRRQMPSMHHAEKSKINIDPPGKAGDGSGFVKLGGRRTDAKAQRGRNVKRSPGRGRRMQSENRKREKPTGRMRTSSGRRLDFVPEGGGSGGSTKGASDAPGPSQLFSVYLYEYEGHDRAQEKLEQLNEHAWIDYHTAWVGVRLLVLNPDLQIFIHVTVNVYFATSGALLPHITAQSFYPDPYQYMSVIAFDAVWLCLLFFLAFTLLKRIHYAVRRAQCKAFLMDPWVWLDAGMVMGGICIVILWLILLDMLVGVKRAAMEVRAREPEQGYTSDVYPTLVAALHDNMNDLSGYLMTLRLAFCWYTILISMKFLESFAAQPRLAVVTQTIYSAGSELFHFLIVLFIVFMAYVIAGMFIFGRRLWEFSSFQRAAAKCFLLMLGDFDWEELGDENPLTAAFWFWTYMIVMMLLMLNMLMAIIMDKYTEVKSDAAAHDTIVKQIKDMILESLQSASGKRVNVGTLIKAVEEMPQTEVNEDDLADAVPHLGMEQARNLMQKTQEHVDNELNKGVTMSEAMRMIGWVKIAVQKIGWKLEEILKDEREERDMLQAQDGDITRRAEENRHGGLEDHDDGAPPYVADAEERLERIESRMQKMEEFMQEALQYTTFRGKDLRNRLAVIEDLIRSQRDATMVNMERDVWNDGQARLGGSSGGGGGFGASMFHG